MIGKILLVIIVMLLYFGIGGLLNGIVFMDDDMSFLPVTVWPLTLAAVIVYWISNLFFDMGRKVKREYKNRKQ